MSNTLKAGLLTVAVLVGSAVVMASSLKTIPVAQSNDTVTAQTAQPMEVVTVVGTRRAS